MHNTLPTHHPYLVSHHQLKAYPALAEMPEPYFALALEYLTLSHNSTGYQPWGSFSVSGLLIPEIIVTVLQAECDFPYAPLTTIPPAVATQYSVFDYLGMDLTRGVIPQPRVYASKQLRTWHGETILASGDDGGGRAVAARMQCAQSTLVFNTGSNWNHNIPVATIGHAQTERFDDGWFIWVTAEDAMRFAAWIAQRTLFQINPSIGASAFRNKSSRPPPSLARIQGLILAASQRPDSPDEIKQAAYLDQLRNLPRQPGVMGFATPDTPLPVHTPSDPEAFRRSPIGAHLRVSNEVEAKDNTQALLATSGNWLDYYHELKSIESQGQHVNPSLKQKVEARPDLLKIMSLIPHQKEWEDRYQNNGVSTSTAPTPEENPMYRQQTPQHGSTAGRHEAHYPTHHTDQDKLRMQEFIRAKWDAATPVNYVNDSGMAAVAIPLPNHPTQITQQGRLVWVISQIPGYQDTQVQFLLEDWIACYIAQYGQPNFNARPAVPIRALDDFGPSAQASQPIRQAEPMDMMTALEALSVNYDAPTQAERQSSRTPPANAWTQTAHAPAPDGLLSLDDFMSGALNGPVTPKENPVSSQEWEANLYREQTGECSGYFQDGVPMLKLTGYKSGPRRQEASHHSCLEDVISLEVEMPSKLIRALTATGVYTLISPTNANLVGSEYHFFCRKIMENRVRNAKQAMVASKRMVTGLEERPIPQVRMTPQEAIIPPASAPAPVAQPSLAEALAEYTSVIPERALAKTETPETVDEVSDDQFFPVEGPMGLWVEKKTHIVVLGRYYVRMGEEYEAACGRVAKNLIGGKKYLQMSRAPELIPRAGYLAYGDTCSYLGNCDWNTLPPAEEMLVREEEIADLAPWLAAPRDAYYDIPRKMILTQMSFFEWLNTVKKLYIEAGYHSAHDPMWVLNQMKRADDGLKYIKLPEKKVVEVAEPEDLPQPIKREPLKKSTGRFGINRSYSPRPSSIAKVSLEINQVKKETELETVRTELASDVFANTPDVADGEKEKLVVFAEGNGSETSTCETLARVSVGEGAPFAHISAESPVTYGGGARLEVALMHDAGELVSSISLAVVSEGGLRGLYETMKERENNATCGTEITTQDREVVRGIARLDAAITDKLNMLHRRHGVYTNIQSFMDQFEKIEEMVDVGLARSTYSDADSITVRDLLSQAYQEFVEVEIENSILAPGMINRIVAAVIPDHDDSEIEGDNKINSTLALGELVANFGIDLPISMLGLEIEPETIVRATADKCDGVVMKSLLELAALMFRKLNENKLISPRPSQQVRCLRVLFMDAVLLIQPSVVEQDVYCVSLR